MARFAAVVGYVCFALCCATARTAAQLPAAATAPALAAAGPTLTLPAGTRIEAALIRPVWTRTAAMGASIYAQATFPAVVGSRIAIPPGTYIEGRIEALTRPTRWHNRASLQILLTDVIFANGYVAVLPGAPGAQDETAATRIAVAVQASAANDLLLDNGAPLEFTLAAPLMLDAEQVAGAASLSRAPEPGQFKSASQCRPVSGSPGTPGSPDTVIPGSPGTPDTVIPGGPGMPDTVIPGTPATPDTVIPGTPGTPGWSGRACPGPPLVLSCTPILARNQAGASSPAAAH